MRRRWIVFALLCPLSLILALLVAYFAFAVSTWDDQGFKDFCGSVEPIRSSFQEFYKGKKDYPEYSMEQLHQMGVFDTGTQEFLQEYWVHYTPFSSKTPDDEIVLRIGYGPFGAIPWLCDFSVTKYELTHDLMAEERQWSERLQVTKEKQVREFSKNHPTYTVVAANPWWKGTTAEDSSAYLTIAYRKPTDSNTYEEHYSFVEKDSDWVLVIKQ